MDAIFEAAELVKGLRKENAELKADIEKLRLDFGNMVRTIQLINELFGSPEECIRLARIAKEREQP
jgi:hypothetical protein